MTAMDATALVTAIGELLPQTQCGKCGYAGCSPYAEAMVSGEAPINRCPPGGAQTITALAGLLGKPRIPLDPACGAEMPRRIALVDEAWCIGCTLCIQACPVDAILGSAKLMHTVLQDLCTGCELCLPPCPVDCISLVPAKGAQAGWDAARARATRARFEARQKRQGNQQRRTQQAISPEVSNAPKVMEEDKQATIQAAIARARKRRALAGTKPVNGGA